ncbi:type II/IV secretion system ATPase subunit [Methanococcoides alaskense]|uniref:Flagellar protein FlaI n=1 Tax=Methanococcoides alaskense TaxID=325778 RepID=A0AA90ZCT0_9EURY|nr:type II/IV secretion system ATPase subunit [Methanococcoides alaskense]MDA0525652.1 type II/IV secretion system ATPase subunit [Methanococcoides alaskense]MDR6222878.1 flagellar protein FlaI [Methanococcoides alaskense]
MNTIDVVEDDLSSSSSLGEVGTSKSSEDQLSNIVEVVEDDSQTELLSKEELESDIEVLLDLADENVDDSSKLPDEINSAWEKTLRGLGAEKRIPEVIPLEIKPDSFFKKFLNMINPKAFELEDYDLAKHGPLVEITLPANSAYKEMEFYNVNPPYSYIRVAYNPEIHEYLYQVLEPELSKEETRLFKMIKERLGEVMDAHLKSMNRLDSEEYLRSNVNSFLIDYRIRITTITREKINYYIIRDYLGYGEVDAIMRDLEIEDISGDGPNTPVYVYHKKYESIPSNIIFDDEDVLNALIIRLAQICGKHISIANPILDATLPDGSRIQMTLGREITTRGSTFTIRRFNENPIMPGDLVGYHTFSTAMLAYLWLAVDSSRSLIFAGGTASGKTTAMNAISTFIQPEMKIVSIEDTRELNLAHPNWIPGVTREAFGGENRGSIEMYELLKAALRQRPEFILVGEVRGAEAYVLFQAMSTGHTTFSTMHADSVSSIVHRLENPPINVPRIMIQALDIVAIQAQVKIGDERVRRCKSLTEIIGVDPRSGELLTNEVFVWNAAKDLFQYSGRSYVLDDLMESRGWDDAKVKEELQERQDVLEWSRLKNITYFRDFSKIVVAHRREPETLMKVVRQDLNG